MKGTWFGSGLGLAIACFANAGFADAGLPPCQTSDSCAAPTPHCHPALHECVECLSSRNCPSGLACNEATGACVGCSKDGDCPALHPYCVASACAECRTEQNCRDGLACVDGQCGTCGDGTCSRRERARSDGFEPGTQAPFEVCPKDCAALLKCSQARLDEVTVLTVGTANIYEPTCANESYPEAMAEFATDLDGSYYLTIKGPADARFFTYTISEGECGRSFGGSSCGYADSQEVRQEVSVRQGQPVTVIIESPVPGTFEVTFSRTPPACEGPKCSPPGGDAGIPNDQGKTICLRAAQERGEEMCAGVTCACSHCPRDYDDCAVIPGCNLLSECMRSKDCVGEECHASGACSHVIDANGGLAGPAFRAANTLQSCSIAFACALPCGDAGARGEPDAGVRVCAPASERSCTCGDGGTGEQRCTDDGAGYGACACAPAEPPPARATVGGSGCDCNVAHGGSSGAALAGLFGIAAALLGRRSRRQGVDAR